MATLLWVLTIFISFVVHKTLSLPPPAVPKTPSWGSLSIDKPRSSVIPTWYDVLVTPQITKEVESKNKTGFSFADLRESLSLNELNLPEVVQKEVILEADEIEIPNSKNTTRKTGTKMRDLYKNRFQKTKKEMKAGLLNNYLIPKILIEEPKANKIKQKDYFPKEEKKPLVPLNSSVPLYVPIFRKQSNDKKRTMERILEKPDFNSLTNNTETNLDNETVVKPRAETFENNKTVHNALSNAENRFINKAPNVINNIDKNTVQHVTENFEEKELIDKVIQAIKDGKLKLDNGMLKFNEENSPHKNNNENVKSNEQNLMLTNLPLHFVPVYPQPKLSEIPQFTTEHPINQQLKELFNQPMILEIENPHSLNEQLVNRQPVIRLPSNQYPSHNPQLSSQQFENQQLLNQQSLNQKLLNHQLDDKPLENQKFANQQLLNKQVLNQQLLNQELVNQQLANQELVASQQLSNQQSANQQLADQLVANKQIANQQQVLQHPLNKSPVNQQTNSLQLFKKQPLDQQFLNQLSANQHCGQQDVNQKSMNQQQLVELINQYSSNSPGKSLENIMKIPQAFNVPNSGMNMNLATNPNDFKGSQCQMQDTQKQIGITQKDSKNDPVLTVFKPDTVSLWETYGKFLKKLEMTVLVPVHTEKILT